MKKILDIRNLKLGIGNSRDRGFTLIELLVVIAIIGILATFMMANFVGVKGRARDAQRKSDLKQIQAALEFYRSDNGGYPSATLGCGGPLTGPAPASIEYMKKIPCDPSTGIAYISSFTNPFPSGTYARNYCLRACLENPNDSQHTPSDACPVSTHCSPSANANYTVSNP